MQRLLKPVPHRYHPLRDMPTVLRYLLLQLPGWMAAAVVLYALSHWWTLPAWVWAACYGTWLLKDAAVYPFVRTAYEGRGRTGVEQLIGCEAVATGPLDPRGYVQIRGELWRAETPPDAPPIGAGSTVTVRGARGLTLIVTRDDGELGNRQ